MSPKKMILRELDRTLRERPSTPHLRPSAIPGFDAHPSRFQDAVNDLLTAFAVPVIFITAYPERFLTGDRPEPAFLIAKPYKPAVVSAIVSQALFFQRNAAAPNAAA